MTHDAGSSQPRPARPEPLGELWFVSALKGVPVLAFAAVLTFFPIVFVRVGLTALGGRLGWWRADPRITNGEEMWAWPLGLVLLAAIAALAWWMLRRLSSDPADLRRMLLCGLPALVVVAIVMWT